MVADTVVTAAALSTTVVGVVVAGAARVVFAAVALVAFAAGTVLLGVALLRAIGRSRTTAISVADLVLVASAPPRTRVALHSCLAVQTVVALAGAGLRPFTALAFGVLTPTFGVGANCWWAARHGTFGSRHDHSRSDSPPAVPGDSDGEPRA